jgi:hypothetical protein
MRTGRAEFRGREITSFRARFTVGQIRARSRTTVPVDITAVPSGQCGSTADVVRGWRPARTGRELRPNARLEKVKWSPRTVTSLTRAAGFAGALSSGCESAEKSDGDTHTTLSLGP